MKSFKNKEQPYCPSCEKALEGGVAEDYVLRNQVGFSIMTIDDCEHCGTKFIVERNVAERVNFWALT